MNWSSLLPSSTLLQGVSGVEAGLRRLARMTAAGRLMFLVAVAILIVTSVRPKGLDFTRTWDVGIAFAVLGLLLWTATRWWIQESTNAFRYTCSVGAFTSVTSDKDEKPNAAIRRRMDALAPDLSWRLNERLQRIFHLDFEGLDKDADLTSHIHVSGTFLVCGSAVAADTIRPAASANDNRQSKSATTSDDAANKASAENSGPVTARKAAGRGNSQLLILARVRVGPKGSPETIAPHITFDLPPSLAFDDAAYDRLIERLYAFVAAEIYKQIRTDVDRKIGFLPTRHLKAGALFHEAQDFSRSNTLNSYEVADALYRRAASLLAPDDPFLTEHDVSAQRAGIRTLRNWLSTAARALRAWNPNLSRANQHHELLLARCETGVATMLLFRHQLSLLLGQPLVNVFETRRFAARALQRLDRLPESLPGRDIALFDGHAAMGLALAVLGDVDKGHESLNAARVALARRAEFDHVYLAASSHLEPRGQQKIEPLFRAAERYPTHQLLTFEYAYTLERAWRDAHFPPQDVRPARMVIDAYLQTLKVNPGHIGALANCGYILWLCGQCGEARTHFERAEQYRSLVPGTVISEIYYGLMRVSVETGRFADAYEYLARAEAAQRTYEATHALDATGYFFDLINEAVFSRFAALRRTWCAHERSVRRASKRRDRLDEVASQRLAVFVLNEYGEAALRLYHRHGDPRHERLARLAFAEAERRLPEYVRTRVNLALIAPDPDTRLEHLFRIATGEPTSRILQLQLLEDLEGRIYALFDQARRANERYAELSAKQASKERELAGLTAAANAAPDASRDTAPGRQRLVPPTGTLPSTDATLETIRHISLSNEISELEEAKAEERRNKKEARQRGAAYASTIRQHAQNWLSFPWMWTKTASGRRFNAASLDSVQLREQGKWEREFGSLEVRALRIWAAALLAGSNAAPFSRLNVERARAVLAHIERTFLPADQRTLWCQSRLAEASERLSLDKRLAAQAPYELANDRANYENVQRALQPSSVGPAGRVEAFENLLARGARGPLVYSDLLWALVKLGHEHYQGGDMDNATGSYARALDAAARLAAVGRDNDRCREPFSDKFGWAEALMRFAVCRYRTCQLEGSRRLVQRAVAAFDGFPVDSDTTSSLAPASFDAADRSAARLVCERLLRSHRPGPELRSVADACMAFVRSGDSVAADPAAISLPVPIHVEIGHDVLAAASEYLANNLAPQVRTTIEEETGVRIPLVRFTASSDPSGRAFRIALLGVPIASGELASGSFETETITVFAPLMRELDSLVRRTLGIWIGTQEVQTLLERHCFKPYSMHIAGFETYAHMQPLVYVVRELVEERVPIVEFSEIYAKWARYGSTHSVDDMIDLVRELPRIRPRLPGNDGAARVALGPLTESWLTSRVRSAAGAQVLVLRPPERSGFLTSLAQALEQSAGATLVVRTPALRRHVWRLMREEAWPIPVIAAHELLVALGPADPVLECMEGVPSAAITPPGGAS